MAHITVALHYAPMSRACCTFSSRGIVAACISLGNKATRGRSVRLRVAVRLVGLYTYPGMYLVDLLSLIQGSKLGTPQHGPQLGKTTY